MTPERITRLKRSFEEVTSQPRALAGRFYEELFGAAPQLRPLFPKDLSSLQGHFEAALALVIRNLENMAALREYPWPGNIRELRNAVERAMILAAGPQLTIPVPTWPCEASRCSLKLVDVQKAHIRNILESTGWRIRGSGGAAERLGLPPTTLEGRMAKLGLIRPTAS